MTQPLSLRSRGEAEVAHLPPLLIRSEKLAGTVILGEHGRKRSGQGDDFWQYRPVQAGDSRRQIDWRRSARGDIEFIRQREWKISQTLALWVDRAASMRFTSDPVNIPEKSDRAALLGMSLSILLNRAGERVGLTDTDLPPRRGRTQLIQIANRLQTDDKTEFGTSDTRHLPSHSRAIFISDFMGSIEHLEQELKHAADRNVQGVLLQILDPAEQNFPYRERTIFESPAGRLQHETLKADGLRKQYQKRLAARQDVLSELARTTGWIYGTHLTSQNAGVALLWLYQILSATGGYR